MTDELHSPEAIQAAWQKAVRQLTDAAEGSPESDRLAARVRDLAAEYRAAIETRYRESRSAQAKERRSSPESQPESEAGTNRSHVMPRDGE